MNFFLYINRKYILVTLFVFVIIFFLLTFLANKQDNFKIAKPKLSNVDISKPKFSINNKSKKILITAEEGNFINTNEILLSNNVRFKSNNFSIETENVVFNRDNQTATSSHKSYFRTKKVTIISDGFDIFEKGDKIFFYGKSSVIIK